MAAITVHQYQTLTLYCKHYASNDDQQEEQQYKEYSNNSNNDDGRGG